MKNQSVTAKTADAIGVFASRIAIDVDMPTIAGNCIVTGKLYSVIVQKRSYVAWQQGELVQNAFPELSKEDREFLISGTSPEGWKEIFGNFG